MQAKRSLRHASLLPRNFRVLYHLGPALDVVVDERCELLGRAALCDECEIGETLFHVGQREDARDFAIESGDDFFGRFCGNCQSVP